MDSQNICNRCKIERAETDFLSHTGTRLKTCARCRQLSRKHQNYQPKKKHHAVDTDITFNMVGRPRKYPEGEHKRKYKQVPYDEYERLKSIEIKYNEILQIAEK